MNTTTRLTMRELQVFMEAVTKTTELLVDKHDCGWFDGGCYTLVGAAFEVIKGVDIFHISRTENNRDHAVLKLDGLDMYFDADGFASKYALFSKMKNEEGVECKYLGPFTDFGIKQNKVFCDIKASLIEQYHKAV